MSRRLFFSLAALVVSACLPWAVPVSADQAPIGSKSVPAGSGLYSTYCAVCHGTDGRGTGPLAESLKRRPADLTQLTKSSGGTYNREMVFQIIDGRKPVKGHGGGDMPVWGDAFERSADAGPQAVTDRLNALVEYLASIQAR